MSKLILIADDNPDILKLLERHLVGMGYLVATATDGVTATLKAKEIKPDLVIVDMQMPGAYGSSVYENLRKDPATQGTPVLFMSGSIGEQAFRKRVPADAKNDFLKKPFDLKTIEQAIKRLLGDNA